MQSDICVFYTNTEALSDELQAHLLDQLPTIQKTKALGMRNKNKKRDFIIGRVLLIHALNKNYSFAIPPSILEQSDKAPSIDGFDAICLSISHSHHIVCCVLHKHPIGIDVEYKKMRQNLVEKSKFFMSLEELEAFKKISTEEKQKEYFYQVWCTKEAVFKALDISQQMKTTFASIHLPDYFRIGKWSLLEKEIGNYHLSLVYGGGEQQVHFVSVDLDREGANKSTKPQSFREIVK